MKFDVIVGNPPYQGTGDETGGASALWRKFVKISWAVVEDGGQMCFIVPRFPNAAKDLKHIFTENQTTTVWTKIGHHFPGIGSSFFAWIVQKTPQYQETNFIDENLRFFVSSEELPKDLKAKPILDKVMNGELFECKSSPEYYHTSVADGKNDDHLFSEKRPGLNFRIRRTSGKNYDMWGAVMPTEYFRPKVVLTYSGYPYYQFHDSNDPIGTIKYQSGHILVANKEEADRLIELYKTKLYLFLQTQLFGGARGMRGAGFYSLPKVDLSRPWTDEEVYAHFGLTQEEIDYIEETIK